MDIKILRSKDVMATEDLLNIKGGLNESLDFAATECECDCWIGNTNTKPVTPTQPGNGKPITPTKPGNGKPSTTVKK